jgi:hypothetical protein
MKLVREPFYRFAAQAGQRDWLFAAVATWILGFGTWQVLYAAYLAAPFPALPPQVAGPDSFVSVIIGDGLALPVLNALVVRFYDLYSQHVQGQSEFDTSFHPQLGGPAQTSIAILLAIAATIATYATWFAAGKVDWTIPHPGELNYAGMYHALFLGAETYFITSFALSVARIFAGAARARRKLRGNALLLGQYAQDFLPLVRIFGGIGLAADVFLLGLLADGVRGSIPLTSYYSAALSNLITLMVVVLASMLLIYRSRLGVVLRDRLAPLLWLLAVLGAALPLGAVYWGYFPLRA